MTVGALVAILFSCFVVWMYRRELRSIPKAIAIALGSLRILALVAILIFILNPLLKTETRITKSSRLVVLVDTSLSMGLKDQNEGNTERRIDKVVAALKNSSTFEQLQEAHDITFYRFGDVAQPEPIATLTRTGEPEPAAAAATATNEELFLRARILGYLGLVLFAIAISLSTIWFRQWMVRAQKERLAWYVASGVWAFIIGYCLVGLADLQIPNLSLAQSLSWKKVETTNSLSLDLKAKSSTPEVPSNSFGEIDWSKELAPSGTSTQLGAAIQNIVNKVQGGPLAGIAVITDGRNNSGLEPTRAIAAAVNSGVPIFPVGIGSTDAPRNVQVADIQVPPRVFPDDKFKVKGLIQSFGLEGKTIRVDLVSVDEKESEAETFEDETSVRLGEDGQTVSVEFEVSRQEQGKRRYLIRTAPVEGDLDPRDDQRGATVEVVDRKTKVLMIAGGPTREFRFLRNQLYRDKDVVLHVWLQSAVEGADQESDEMLFEFPQTREGMFGYDCIIAFDPDWRDFDATQASLLERWVAEKAGGMLLVAGPVNMPEWTRRPRGDEAIDKIRRLYPVSFYSQGSAVLKIGRFGGERAFPLEFTREGRAAEYLWLGDTSTASLSTWGQFDGVFGYYAVNEAKAGADILANFADPETLINDRLPIYLASHFYGSGRVFFQASGEMWRVRRLDVEYFQNYYLKLMRWISQGRLLRDSTRGVLLTDRERCWMGDQVVVQAMLRDAQDEPLMLESVNATILRPDGSSESLTLQATKDSVRPGTFNGQLSANLEGEYRISLPIPNSPEMEFLMAQVQSNIPDLEKERPQRNDALLSEFADKTRGHYFVGMNAWNVEASNPLSPVSLIQSQDQELVLPGAPDRNFQRLLMMWLLGLIVLSLCVEWTLRRLHKLA